MDTQYAVTHSKRQKSNRTAADAQPVPRSSAMSPQESRYLGAQDAERVVQWFNASTKTASQDRVVRIFQELVDLRSEFVARADAYRHVSGGVIRLGEALDDVAHWPKEKLQVQRQLHNRHVELNRALEKYAFRPRATYVIADGRWIFGMVPDDNGRWFQLKIGSETITEADVVLSLVRLAEAGDLGKIQRCEMCKLVWLFAAKRNYRFCSNQCREGFYAKSADYHGRKAANQQRYRERLKRSKAAY
jgi:hypothetical protein